MRICVFIISCNNTMDAGTNSEGSASEEGYEEGEIDGITIVRRSTGDLTIRNVSDTVSGEGSSSNAEKEEGSEMNDGSRYGKFERT